MKADPLLSYFNELRNTFEKEGMPKPVYATVESEAEASSAPPML